MLDLSFHQIDVGDIAAVFGALSTAIGGFFLGRSNSRKTLAEAAKLQAETKKLLDDQATTAENRLHDQIMASFKTLADLYEKNLDSMKSTIENMDREISELRAENERLSKTVHELTQDKEQLRRTVDDLRRHIERLIDALRSAGNGCADDPRIAPLLTGLDLPKN